MGSFIVSKLECRPFSEIADAVECLRETGERHTPSGLGSTGIPANLEALYSKDARPGRLKLIIVCTLALGSVCQSRDAPKLQFCTALVSEAISITARFTNGYVGDWVGQTAIG